MSFSLPIPEEILDNILDIVINGNPSFPHSHLLLVSKSFLRITTPLLYRSVHLRSRAQSTKLAATLASNPLLGQSIRSLKLDGPYPAVAAVLRALPADRPLHSLDLSVDDPQRGCSATIAEDADLLSTALLHIPDLKHLVVRKSGYLTAPPTKRVITALAEAISCWHSLESADLQYRPSPLPTGISTTPIPVPTPSPRAALPDAAAAVASQAHIPPHDALSHALAHAPRLTCIRAHTPAIWNSFLLTASANPALARIELVDGSSAAAAAAEVPHPPVDCADADTDGPGVVPTSSLFMKEATHHPRLHALILAGRRHMFVERLRLSSQMPISRTRAQTIPSASPSPTFPSSPTFLRLV